MLYFQKYISNLKTFSEKNLNEWKVRRVYSHIKNKRIPKKILSLMFAWWRYCSIPFKSLLVFIQKISPFSKRMKPNLLNTLSVTPEVNTQRTKNEPSSYKIQRYYPFPNDTLKSAWSCNGMKDQIKERSNCLSCVVTARIFLLFDLSSAVQIYVSYIYIHLFILHGYITNS